MLARPAKERITIQQFSDLPPSHYFFPTALTSGPDGALWVADDIDQDIGASAIARITTSGKRTATYSFQNYASPAFEDIAAGPDGALWIADSGDLQILRMTTAGGFTSFPLQASPQAIVSGPDHALWFVQNAFSQSSVVRITTTGKMTTFTKGISSGTALEDIAVGPDHALWFTESTGNRIGRITTQGKVTEFSKGISPSSQPYSIAPGPDGALWFTEFTGGRIGRITTSGKVTERSHGITPGEKLVDLAAGADGAIWFTEYQQYGSYPPGSSKIGRITTSGKITEYSSLDPKSGPTGIVAGPDGNMWFVETATNRLGRVNL
jgi:virginiamycin B lyase